MVEVITLTAVSFGSLLSGVALIETIFNWPGLGKLLIDAVISKDIPIIQGVVVWLVLAYVMTVSYTHLDVYKRQCLNTWFYWYVALISFDR